MKILIAFAATGLASIPFVTDGSECSKPAEKTSCCPIENAEGASLASATVVQPTVPVKYDPDSTGSIAVTAVFDGKVPDALPPLTLDTSKTQGCEDTHTMDMADRSRLVNKEGRIQNVVVMVEIDDVKPEVPDAPYVLDQRGCRYEPHVLVVPVGAEIEYKNSDGINHNVHTFSKKNAAMNNNVAAGASERQKFEKTEDFAIKCDIHPWMSSYVVVTDAARFGTTDANGTFKLEGLPPGEYKVEYWHETLGKGKSESIQVEAGATANAEIKIGEAKKKSGRGRRGR